MALKIMSLQNQIAVMWLSTVHESLIKRYNRNSILLCLDVQQKRVRRDIFLYIV